MASPYDEIMTKIVPILKEYFDIVKESEEKYMLLAWNEGEEPIIVRLEH